MMTKRFLMAASAAVGLLAAASSASAAPLLSGTITLNGTVTTSCSASGGNLNASHTLTPMAQANGAIDTTLSGSTLASPRTTDSFTVTCNGSNLLVQVSANQMLNTTNPNIAPAGYADKIRFTATARALTITGAVNGQVDVTDTNSTDATAVQGPLGVGAFFRAPTAANLSVYTYAYNTNGNTTDVVTAGDYTGTVTVTIATNP
jgi:hypothetical protein